MTTSPGRWHRIEALCQAALDRPAAERDAYLRASCGEDADLRQEVEALLAQESAAESFLDSPVAAVAAQVMPTATAPLSGLRLGAFELGPLLGSGGMGDVYRAHDTRLGRDVAVKVLPPEFSGNPDRLARFEREARLLASLNHPHIEAIYGIEQAPGVAALVLELVEGPTLADLIAGGALPIEDALPIARQIAEALAAAHEQGIIHRDLKPANIKLTTGGVAKVLDFGLAKIADPGSPGDPETPVPLRQSSSAVLTQVGSILGTAAYMSPERTKGLEADKRSDVWAFGCVLYEMLSGSRAFAPGASAVVQLEPNWAALPSDVPQPILALLHGCLIKDRRRRVADISTALFVLDAVASLTPVGPPDVAPSRAQVDAAVAGTRREPTWSAQQPVALVGAVAVAVGAVVAAPAVWLAMRTAEPVSPRVARLTITPTSTAALAISGNDCDLAITPDGARVVYVGNRGTQLVVRAIEALEPVAVYTGEPRGPFVSPDGQWIGFVDSNTVLKKVPVTGGPAVTLATLDGRFRGAAWGSDDTIIVATQDVTTGLQRVTTSGGPTTVLTRPDHAQGEADHLRPELLPGGGAVLFTVTALTGGSAAARVEILNLQSGERRILVRGGSDAHYVGGYLVYGAAGGLWAVAFDLALLESRGTPLKVVPEVMTTPLGIVDAAVARNGTLAYVSERAGGGQRTLVWVDRQGRETPIAAPPRRYLYPRLSPDGTRIAVYVQDRERDIWLWHLGPTTLTRLTFDPGLDASPVWTPDSRRVIFSSERAGVRNLFSQSADGSGTPVRLTESPNMQNATAMSPDGRRLIFTEIDPSTGDDVMQLVLDGARTQPGRAIDARRDAMPLVQSPLVERNGVVSPHGDWLAYEASDSGEHEVYVRPLPEVNGGRWQVSTAGGTRPLWARDGQELFYVSATGALMRVGIESGSSWATTKPTRAVQEGYLTSSAADPGRSYDIAPDGQQFLMIKGSGLESAEPPSVIVVLNWVEELKRLVPPN